MSCPLNLQIDALRDTEFIIRDMRVDDKMIKAFLRLFKGCLSPICLQLDRKTSCLLPGSPAGPLARGQRLPGASAGPRRQIGCRSSSGQTHLHESPYREENSPCLQNDGRTPLQTFDERTLDVET